MKKIHVFLAALALVALATVGHSVARAASPAAKAHGCCDGGSCGDCATCCP